MLSTVKGTKSWYQNIASECYQQSKRQKSQSQNIICDVVNNQRDTITV